MTGSYLIIIKNVHYWGNPRNPVTGMLCYCFLIILLMAAGCKKGPFDYRHPYIGGYVFNVHETSWTPLQSIDTVYSYCGDISYGESYNTVNIKFSENLSQLATVYEDGSFEYYFYDFDLHFSGKFDTKEKVSFDYTSDFLGGGGSYTVTGIKYKK